MSKENKNKEKQRNSAGYVEPDRIVEKKDRLLCVACQGSASGGELILGF